MNWLASLLRKAPQLSTGQAAALQAIQRLERCPMDTPLAAQRFIVLDVESTGLDVFSDRLIAIGAVCVTSQMIELGQGFETVLQQDNPSTTDNILIHGIGGTTQITGKNPADALLQFMAYAGNAPLVAYHADFDRAMMDRATKTYLGTTLPNPWIDLAFIAPALFPQPAGAHRALDDWTTHFNIENTNRHNALADACATAQLLLVLLAHANSSRCIRLQDFIQLEKDQRWLGRA